MYLHTYLHFLGIEYISQQPVPTSKEVGTYLAMCTYSDLIGIHDVTLITATMPRKSYSYVLTLSRQNLLIFVGPLKILIVPTSTYLFYSQKWNLNTNLKNCYFNHCRDATRILLICTNTL